jgi:hypothetical protein
MTGVTVDMVRRGPRIIEPSSLVSESLPYPTGELHSMNRPTDPGIHSGLP